MSDDAPLTFGLAVPVFASPGIATMRTPSLERASWSVIRDAVHQAESLGYESAWFSDHMFHGRDGEFFESWTTLCAFADSTTRIRLVNNHLNNNFRPAPMTAKTTATLDVITGGRLELFLSPGMREREHTSYGFGWEPDPVVRVRRLEEAITLIRSTWTGESTRFKGEFYELEGAINTPAPVQQGGPPIWVGGILDESTLGLIARRADGWNTFPTSLDEYRLKVEAVEEACRKVGRDPGSLRRSLETQVLVLEHPSDWDRWMDRWDELRSRAPLGDAVSDMLNVSDPIADGEAYRLMCEEQFVIGTRQEVAEKLRAYQHLGVTDFVCWFMDAPAVTSMRILAEEIRPTLA